MGHAQVSVILQEIGESHILVPERRKYQNIAGPNVAGPVDDGPQLSSLAERTKQPSLTPHPLAI